MVVLCGSAYRNRGVEPLLDAVVAYLPSPLDVPPVRGVHDGEEQERPADPAAPFAALAFKVNATPTGRLTYLRVYSGTIEKGDTVLDAGARRTERIGRILRVQADRHAHAGPGGRRGHRRRGRAEVRPRRLDPVRAGRPARP